MNSTHAYMHVMIETILERKKNNPNTVVSLLPEEILPILRFCLKMRESLEFYKTIGSNISLPIELCGPIAKMAKETVNEIDNEVDRILENE